MIEIFVGFGLLAAVIYLVSKPKKNMSNFSNSNSLRQSALSRVRNIGSCCLRAIRGSA